MRRREFIRLLGTTAVAWPRAVRAQPPPIPVVGYLGITSPGASPDLHAAFRRGLKEAGYVEGQNVSIEYRFAEGHYDRLPALAAELVQRQVNVIVTAGGSASALAAKAATTKIPIVFSGGDDPIERGVIASLNRPGGNVTGATFFSTVLAAKRLELLHEVVPKFNVMAMLVNPSNGRFEGELRDAQEAAVRIGVRLVVLKASNQSEIDTSFATLDREGVGALLVGSDAFFYSRRDQLVALAARHGVPAIYQLRDFAAAGGLMSYGTNVAESYYQVGVYSGRILKGEKPAELPVLQSTKFQLVINLKTAKALGLTITNAMQLLADEVIE